MNSVSNTATGRTRAWALYSHHVKAWLAPGGAYVPTVQQAAAVSGAPAFTMVFYCPGDIVAHAVWLK